MHAKTKLLVTRSAIGVAILFAVMVATAIWLSRISTPDDVTAEVPGAESTATREREPVPVPVPVPVPAPVPESDEDRDQGAKTVACSSEMGKYRSQFTTTAGNMLALDRLVEVGVERDQVVFYARLIAATGQDVFHRWYHNDVALQEHGPFRMKAERQATWSTQNTESLGPGTLRVEVRVGNCPPLGQDSVVVSMQERLIVPAARGWMRPQYALEKILSDQSSLVAATAERRPVIDDLSNNGDTFLLAAIRRGDRSTALGLINGVIVTSPDEPKLSKAQRQRRSSMANPFLRDANRVSPIDLAHQLGQDAVVEALIKSAINPGSKRRGRGNSSGIGRWGDSVINSLMANDGGAARYDDGDTPLLRAVRTGNERAVVTMLRLASRSTSSFISKPTSDVFAYDASGRQSLDIAREKGYYGIEQILKLAMRNSYPTWAVFRSTFATTLNGQLPGNCRRSAFADERQLHFFAELSDIQGTNVSHEWHYKGKVIQRVEFNVEQAIWPTVSSMQFSPEDVGQWQVKVVTRDGQVLRTSLLSYSEVTKYNKTNRDAFITPCSMGLGALYKLVKAHAPINKMQYLFDHGLALKLNSQHDKDIFKLAIEGGSISHVRWFLERGIDIEGYLSGGKTPVTFAAEEGDLAMTLFLVRRGADLNAPRHRNKMTVLQIAARENNAELANLLLANQADPNLATEQGHTPLHWAVGRCNLEVTAALLEGGADPLAMNKKGRRPADDALECVAKDGWDANSPALAALYAESGIASPL